MKKFLVFAIVILFIGASIVPSISGNIRDQGLQQRDERLRKTYITNGNDYRNEFDTDDYYYVNPFPDFEPVFWWNLWKDLPGRYEPFFDVNELITVGQHSHGMTTADFNDDGLMDFAVSYRNYSYYSNISIFYNNGDDIFTEGILIKIKDYNIPHPTDIPINIDDLNAADYDNDDDIDLLFTYNEIWLKGSIPYNWNGTGIILFNDGSNNFENWQTVFWHKPFGNSSLDKRINAHITSNDFDNDGNIDFLVGDNTGGITFYKNDGTGNFKQVCHTEPGGGILSWGVASADFDNNGDIDFIMAQRYDKSWLGHIYLIWNDGTPSCFNHSDYVEICLLPPVETIFTVGPSETGCLSTLDYNDDGNMDFMFGGRGNVWLFVQKDIGVFEPVSVCRFSQSAAPDGGWYLDDTLREGGMAVGDFNGDGLDDVITSGSSSIVRLFYNNYILVDIVHPDSTSIIVDNAIVTFGFPIYRLFKYGISVVIGDLKVVATPLGELSKVEFYLNGRLKFTDKSEPFEWGWKKLSIGRYKIKAVGYNMDGEQSGFDKAIVLKFF